jgi:predicted unusual protein kinase regulating ubiquinone biosynthesis (AarF/ABC1/UbiB family)
VTEPTTHTLRDGDDGGAAGKASDVLGPIPRRRQIITPATEPSAVPRVREIRFKAGLGRPIGRLFRWLWLIGHVLGGTLWDRLRGRDSLARRAIRLRHGLERAGGTLVKFGQQLAMRIDLLPWEYCVELSKMLDRMPAFAVADAVAAIERAAGRPWQEVFQVFDPEPVGSASVACVYQAILQDGTKVAVKIRRPGIGDVFMADLRVLDWVCGVAEFLTVIRPGTTLFLRQELRATLLEELDFRKEGRYQDIFRRNAKRSGKRFFTAPRVHFELSSDEVLTQEFVSGMWLWEVIGAIEQKDADGLERMRQLNLDPAVIGRRILWSTFWSGDETLFFHADPHPANIVVGADNRLTFVDFGSCGSFDEEQRSALEQMVVSMRRGDAAGMARGGLRLLEPVQPVDVSAVLKDLEDEYMRMLYIFRTKAKYTEWWERTSMRQWLGLVKISQRHGLRMNLHTLRMVRATLLYDTLVMRLDRSIDRYELYDRFRTRDRARWARQRWGRRVREFRRDLPLTIEELVEAGTDLVQRAQHATASPVLLFHSVVNKSAFTLGVLGRMLGRLLLITGAAVAVAALVQEVRGAGAGAFEPVLTVFRSTAYRVLVTVVVLLHVRQILFRLRDRDSVPKMRVSGESVRS